MAKNIIDLGFAINVDDATIESQADKIVKILNAAVEKGLEQNDALEKIANIRQSKIDKYNENPSKNSQTQIKQLQEIATLTETLNKSNYKFNFGELNVNGKTIGSVRDLHDEIKSLFQTMNNPSASLADNINWNTIMPKNLTQKIKSIKTKLEDEIKNDISSNKDNSNDDKILQNFIKQNILSASYGKNGFKSVAISNVSNLSDDNEKILKAQGIQDIEKWKVNYNNAIQNIDIKKIQNELGTEISKNFADLQVLTQKEIDKFIEDANEAAKLKLKTEKDNLVANIQEGFRLSFSNPKTSEDKKALAEWQEYVSKYERLYEPLDNRKLGQIIKKNNQNETITDLISSGELSFKQGGDYDIAKLRKMSAIESQLQEENAQYKQQVAALQDTMANQLRDKFKAEYVDKWGASQKDLQWRWGVIGDILQEDTEICNQFFKSASRVESLKDFDGILDSFEEYQYDIEYVKNNKEKKDLRNTFLNNLKSFNLSNNTTDITQSTEGISKNTKAIEDNTNAKKKNAKTSTSNPKTPPLSTPDGTPTPALQTLNEPAADTATQAQITELTNKLAVAQSEAQAIKTELENLRAAKLQESANLYTTEIQEVEKLQNAINTLIEKINEKTSAIKAEAEAMTTASATEVEALNNIVSKVLELQETIKTIGKINLEVSGMDVVKSNLESLNGIVSQKDISVNIKGNINDITVDTEKIKNEISSAINQGIYTIKNIDVDKSSISAIRQSVESDLSNINTKIQIDTPDVTNIRIQSFTTTQTAINDLKSKINEGLTKIKITNFAPVQAKNVTDIKTSISEKLTNVKIQNFSVGKSQITEIKSQIQSGLTGIKIGVNTSGISSIAKQIEELRNITDKKYNINISVNGFEEADAKIKAFKSSIAKTKPTITIKPKLIENQKYKAEFVPSQNSLNGLKAAIQAAVNSQPLVALNNIDASNVVISKFVIDQKAIADIKNKINGQIGNVKINLTIPKIESIASVLAQDIEAIKSLQLSYQELSRAVNEYKKAQDKSSNKSFNEIQKNIKQISDLEKACNDVKVSVDSLSNSLTSRVGNVVSEISKFAEQNIKIKEIKDVMNALANVTQNITFPISDSQIDSVNSTLKRTEGMFGKVIEQLNNFKNVDSGALDIIKSWETHINLLAEKIKALHTGLKNVASAVAPVSGSSQTSSQAAASQTQTNEGNKQVQQANSKTKQAQIQTNEAAKQTAEATKQTKQAKAKTAEAQKQTSEAEKQKQHIEAKTAEIYRQMIEAQKQPAAASQWFSNKEYAASTLKEFNILFSKTQKKYFDDGFIQQLKSKQTEILKMVDNIQRREKAYTQGNINKINEMKQTYIEIFNLFMNASSHKGTSFQFHSQQMLADIDNISKKLNIRNITDFNKDISTLKQQIESIKTSLSNVNSESYKDLEKLRIKILNVTAQFKNLKSIASKQIVRDESNKIYAENTLKKFQTLVTKGNNSNLSKNFIQQLETKQTEIESLLNKIGTGEKSYSQFNIDKINRIKQEYLEMLDLFSKASLSNENPFGLDTTKMLNDIDKISSKLQFRHLDGLNPNISKLKQEINEIQNNPKNIKDMDYNALREYEYKIKNINNSFDEIRQMASSLLTDDTSIGSINKLNAKFDDLIAKMQQYYRMNTKIQRDHTISSQFQTMISNAQSMERTTVNLNQLNSQYQMLKNTIESKGLTGRSIGDELKYIAEKIGLKAILGNQIYRIIGYFKQMVTVVREIDTGMTTLKRVSDETAETYNKFLTSAKKSAKELGTELNSVVDATSSFARLGYNLQESTALAQNAIMYKNVGWLDIETATNDIVSAMKAFNITAEESIKIVDTFDILGNKFALTSADVGSGLRTSASALAAANNTMEQSAAMITAITEITQDSSNAGNALKILSMRLRGASAELEAEGEDVEGLCDSTSKLRDQLKSLAGVDIMQNEDTFKSTYQIMSEIAHEWNNISDINQAALLETIAGKTRANQVAALLNNWSQAEKALENSLNSAGTAAKENEVYLDSIEGKIAQLKATAQGLSNDIINSNWVKGFVDIVNSLLTGFDAITEGLQKMMDSVDDKGFSKYFDTWKSVPSILTAVTVALTAMKKEVGMKMPFTPATEWMHKPENCWETLMPVYQSAA